jgi:hypothetical protein
MTAYIEREGRQFGFEDRVRIREPKYGVSPDPVIKEIEPTSILTFPVFRARLWGLLHGYEWLSVR